MSHDYTDLIDAAAREWNGMRADAIAAQAAEITALHAEIDACHKRILALEAERDDVIERLRAERDAAAVADAKRYRWLREYGNGIYMDVFNDDEAPTLPIAAAAVRLDTAIDAVRQEKP